MADAEELEVQDVDLRNRFECALEIAKKAGELALRYYSGREGLVIESKATLHDLVSVADRNVETLIRERISAAFPEDRMLGEEFGLTARKAPELALVEIADEGETEPPALVALRNLVRPPDGMVAIELDDGRRVFAPAGASAAAVKRHLAGKEKAS